MNKILSFLGVNSLLIYLLHGYPGAIHARLFEIIHLKEYVTSDFAYAVIQTIVGLLILAPMILIINKYFGWTIGKKH